MDVTQNELPPTSTIAIYYYYPARQLILVLPSHKGWKAESTFSRRCSRGRRRGCRYRCRRRGMPTLRHTGHIAFVIMQLFQPRRRTAKSGFTNISLPTTTRTCDPAMTRAKRSSLMLNSTSITSSNWWDHGVALSSRYRNVRLTHLILCDFT